ncbi:MAG: Gfo/Idh/MocA family protein [bacterium]
MKIKTAVLGYGRNGSTMHAGAIENSSDFEMTAVCDIDPERRKQAEERFNCNTYHDYKEMLEGEELDLVTVVTYSDLHAQHTCDCLQAGVNVLVTKPWCVNEKEAREMIKERNRSGKLLLPWLPSRWGSTFKRLQELVKKKVIGDIFYLRRGVYSFGTRNDWQTLKERGGGYVLNWGPHIVDPPVQLFGEIVDTVYGQTGLEMNPGDAEDWFMSIITLENGVKIQAEYNIAVKGLPDWFIQGDRGTIIVNKNNITIYQAEIEEADDPTSYNRIVSEPEVIEEEVGEGIYGDTDEVYREVAAAIKGEREYPVTCDSALYLTRILDAIKISDEKGEVVKL